MYADDLPQISVEEFAQRLADVQPPQAPLQLVDVREPMELRLAAIDGFINLPLSEYGNWSEQIHALLDSEQETIVMCHHGMRSAQMTQWLISQGFTNVQNLAGGIDAYSVKVDHSIPRY